MIPPLVPSDVQASTRPCIDNRCAFMLTMSDQSVDNLREARTRPIPQGHRDHGNCGTIYQNAGSAQQVCRFICTCANIHKLMARCTRTHNPWGALGNLETASYFQGGHPRGWRPTRMQKPRPAACSRQGFALQPQLPHCVLASRCPTAWRKNNMQMRCVQVIPSGTLSANRGHRIRYGPMSEPMTRSTMTNSITSKGDTDGHG